ncbi:adenylyl-sulfate kinase [Paenibacillus allorhizosphaerae]|uniref:Adenylyl-sulfate kinase n=1 Tax=Paenibacillus allorhizosphaerae TaxID=2849866 RepID=A0ABM8VE97_9BACL|nr:adenylyl-sulfate kinase [Paenibacillus allorhizosphaerae]CAG7630608.1 putative adenylyl-sulfate kinase [Paenibacillus allorhizosphaerae]
METNITRHPSHITRDHRHRLNMHHSCVLWLTGLSGSGKSTLAYALEKALYHASCRSYVLDGDNIRHGLNQDLGFHPEDRKENIRRIAEVAKLFADAGMIAVTAFISPYRADREMARSIVGEGDFIEIYVKCSLSECERRDPKGLYQKARAGEITQFTGISAPYEPPERPELVIESDRYSVSESVDLILNLLSSRTKLSLENRNRG